MSEKPKVPHATKVAHFTEYLNELVASGTKRVKELNARLERDPFEALRWSGSTFEDVARGQVAKILLRHLGSGMTAKRAHEMCRENALQRARYPHHGGSPTHALADVCEGQAWAEVEEAMRHWGFEGTDSDAQP